MTKAVGEATKTKMATKTKTATKTKAAAAAAAAEEEEAGFGTAVTNIILLWIQNFSTTRTTLTA